MGQQNNTAHMVQKLFSRFFQVEETVTGKKRPQPRADAAYIPPQKSFEDSLREIASKKKLVVAGNLHVLNTKKIKEKLGPKWLRLKTTIQMNIEKIINDHLGPGDEMLNHGDLNYVIAFADLNENEAAVRLKTISRKIIKQIFGTDALLKGFELESTAAAIDAHNLRDEKASLSSLLSMLQQLAVPVIHDTKSLEEEDTDPVPVTKTPPNPDDLIARISAILDKISASVGQLNSVDNNRDLSSALGTLMEQMNEAFFSSQMMLSEIAETPSTDPQLMQTAEFLNNLNQLSAQLNGELSQIQKAVNEAIQEGEDAPAAINDNRDKRQKVSDELLQQANTVTVDPDDDDLLNSHSELLTDFGEDASFQYFPMWDVKLNVVNTYRCSIALLQKGKIHELASMLPPNCPDHVYERLNLLIAQKVILDIQEAAASEIVCAFNVPIRFSLLQNAKTRTAFTNMLKHLNHGEKQRLVIELTDIDKNTWSSRIIEVVGYLKPYCRATLIRVPQNFKDFADLKTGGVYAVGFHLPDLQGNEASKFKDLERLVIAAERVGLITYVGGVDNPSLAASAVGSGVRYIGGHAIGTPLDFPWGILPFELGNIYARHMTG